MFILCSPYNPVGRVFDREELAQLAAICNRHDVVICSDEIHSDVVYPGHRHPDAVSGGKGVGDVVQLHRHRGALPRPQGLRSVVTPLTESVTLTADPATNALVIQASKEAYETILQVIEKLDVERPQVSVEALSEVLGGRLQRFDPLRNLGIEPFGEADRARQLAHRIGQLGAHRLDLDDVAFPVGTATRTLFAKADGTVQFQGRRVHVL